MKEKLKKFIKSETFGIIKDYGVEATVEVATSTIRTFFFYFVLALLGLGAFIIGTTWFVLYLLGK